MTERASQAQPLSQWLQIMLAEIAAKREAEEHARAEEARRRLEHAANEPALRRGETHSS